MISWRGSARERQRDLGRQNWRCRRVVERSIECIEQLEQSSRTAASRHRPSEVRDRLSPLCPTRAPGEHRQQSPRRASKVSLAGRPLSRRKFAVERDPLRVVDVGQSAERLSVRCFERRIGGRAQCPASRRASPAVLRRDRRPRAGGRGDRGTRLAEYRPARRAGRDTRSPARTANGCLEVVEDDLAALAIEIDGAAGRQKWEVRRRPGRRPGRAARSTIARGDPRSGTRGGAGRSGR